MTAYRVYLVVFDIGLVTARTSKKFHSLFSLPVPWLMFVNRTSIYLPGVTYCSYEREMLI